MMLILILITAFCFGDPVMFTVKLFGEKYPCAIYPISGQLCSRDLRTSADCSQKPTMSSYLPETGSWWDKQTADPSVQNVLLELNKNALDAKAAYLAAVEGSCEAYIESLKVLISYLALLEAQDNPNWNKYREFITGESRKTPPSAHEDLPHATSMFAGAWALCSALKGLAVIVGPKNCKGLVCVVDFEELDILPYLLEAGWKPYYDEDKGVAGTFDVKGKPPIITLGAYDEKTPPGPGNPLMLVMDVPVETAATAAVAQ